jgi:two-component system response regulator AtoC
MTSAKLRKSREGERLEAFPPDEVLFGISRAMMEVRQRAEKVCRINVPVLMQGAGGTGKEALARWIHSRSPYCNGQFVKVNCAAIPSSLLESELFGFEKGAFTGAQATKPGRVELAHQGTLFLDEISELDLGLQSKLLQFLQDGRFSRIGGEGERVVETRLICSTNKDLEHEIASGRFRADLYYRIKVVHVTLPRLRERAEDIPLLAEYFLSHFQRKFATKAEPMSLEMLRYLQQLEWPGNIRQLSNAMARHVLIGGEAVLPEELAARRPPAETTDSAAAGMIPLKQVAKNAVRDLERNVILGALRANQWNRRKTAVALKISYRTLIYKLRGAGLVSGGAAHLESD